MTHLSMGRNRPLPLAERTLIAAAGLWRKWRNARIRAKVARELRDYDQRLLHDMGLVRGDYDSIQPLR